MSARSIQGRLGAEYRFRPDADHTELHRDLKAARLEEYIRRTVDDAPALTNEQRDRLAALIRGGDAA